MSVTKHSVTSAAATPEARGGLPLLILSGVLWGTGGLTGRLLARASHLAPAAVAGYRLAIGGTLIVAFLLAARRPRPSGRAAWIRVARVGGLSAAFQGCYFGAVALTSVSVATLVAIGAAPVVVLAVERVTGRRRLDRAAVGTVALALCGLGLLVGRPTSGASATALVAGVGLALGAATGFAAITLVCAEPVPGLDELTMTGYGFALGGLVLLPLAALTTGAGFAPRPASITLLLVLGLAPTALAYTFFFRGLRTVAASTATVTALLEPLTGTLLAALILHDRIGLTGGAGAALLAVSVVLTSRDAMRPRQSLAATAPAQSSS